MRWIGLMLLGGLLAGGVSAEDWPAFRGPRGNGTSTETKVPTEWSQDQNVKWVVDLPGEGNGSPIVSLGKVFVTCATAGGKQRMLVCYDRTNGDEQWRQTVNYDGREPTHNTNPYAGSTPAADGKQIVVWHGSAGVFCYDYEGQELWSAQPGDVTHIWGYGSSPVIHQDRVLLNYGPTTDQNVLIALSLEDGKELWRTPEPPGENARQGRYAGSWSTPMIAEIGGRTQIILSMPTRVVAYEPEKGSILWSVGGLPSSRGDLVYTSPVLTEDFGVALGGFKGPAIGFKLGGAGDVTEANRVWQTETEQPQRIGSGVVVEGYLYIANAGPGTAQCIDIKTGEVQWQARLPGDHWASLILANGLLYATSQNAATTVFKVNPKEFEQVSVNNLNETTNSTPAFSDGEIFIRTYPRLYCIAEK